MEKEFEELKKDIGWMEDIFYSFVDDMKDLLFDINNKLKKLEKCLEKEKVLNAKNKDN